MQQYRTCVAHMHNTAYCRLWVQTSLFRGPASYRWAAEVLLVDSKLIQMYKAFPHSYGPLLGTSRGSHFLRMSDYFIHKLNLVCHWTLPGLDFHPKISGNYATLDKTTKHLLSLYTCTELQFLQVSESIFASSVIA